MGMWVLFIAFHKYVLSFISYERQAGLFRVERGEGP